MARPTACMDCGVQIIGAMVVRQDLPREPHGEFLGILHGRFAEAEVLVDLGAMKRDGAPGPRILGREFGWERELPGEVDSGGGRVSPLWAGNWPACWKDVRSRAKPRRVAPLLLASKSSSPEVERPMAPRAHPPSTAASSMRRCGL